MIDHDALMAHEHRQEEKVESIIGALDWATKLQYGVASGVPEGDALVRIGKLFLVRIGKLIIDELRDPKRMGLYKPDAAAIERSVEPLDWNAYQNHVVKPILDFTQEGVERDYLLSMVLLRIMTRFSAGFASAYMRSQHVVYD